MTASSTRRRAGLAAAAVVLAPLAAALPAAASATSNEVVFTADADGDGSYNVVLRDLGTRRSITVLAANPTSRWLYDDPELSPRGDRIALSTDRGAARYDEGIAVVGRDGRGFRRLTEPPAAAGTTYTVDIAPAWSPDGSTLLFTRLTTDTADAGNIRASTALYTVPAAGGTPTAVPNASDGYLGDWSPDGRSIVFVALEPDADSGPVTVMGVDGSGRQALPGAVGNMPTWSPDGETIAYATITSRDSDRARGWDVAQIATVPATGGTPTVLAPTRPTAAPSVAGYPSWSPDGESLVYDLFTWSATRSAPPGDLWTVDRAGTRSGRLVAGAYDEAQGSLQGPRPGAVAAGAASTYTPVTARRVLDTRTGLGVRRGRVGRAGTVTLAVPGLRTSAGIVPANASAVVVQVTALDATATTDVRAYAAGSAAPAANHLSVRARTVVPNLVHVPLGRGGAFVLRNAVGSVHLAADLVGWYAPDGSGAGFAATDPGRILDTRLGVGARAARVGAARSVDVRVTGALRTADGGVVTVPSDARAVVLSVAAMTATRTTDVRVYPTPEGAAVPAGSNLNVPAGQTSANLVVVPVGRGGTVRMRNTAGSVHLAADLAGWYSPGASGRFVPIGLTRFLDTRTGLGGAPLALSAGSAVDLRVAGARGVPADATAAVLNVHGLSASGTTDLRAYPLSDRRVPRVSNVPLVRGTTRAGAVVVRTGSDGRVRLRNSAGQVHVVADLAGYMVG